MAKSGRTPIPSPATPAEGSIGSGDLQDAWMSAYTDYAEENHQFVVNSIVEMGQLSERNKDAIESLKKEYTKVVNLCEELKVRFDQMESELKAVAGEQTSLKEDFGKVVDAADDCMLKSSYNLEIFVARSRSDLNECKSVADSVRRVP